MSQTQNLMRWSSPLPTITCRPVRKEEKRLRLQITCANGLQWVFKAPFWSLEMFHLTFWYHLLSTTSTAVSEKKSCRAVYIVSRNQMYRRPQENANWLRKVSLMKNPHFWWYQADILAIWPNHEVVILTKFHQNWTKIDKFSLIVHF